MNLNLERVLVVDGYYLGDPLDYELRPSWLIRDDLVLHFVDEDLVLRRVTRHTDVANHPRLYITRKLNDSVRVAVGLPQTDEIVAEVAACLLRMSAIDFLIDCVMNDSEASDEFRVVR